MESKRTLEKIVAPIRLGWHGVLTGLTGATIAYFSDNTVAQLIAGMGMGFGGVSYYFSLKAFLRTRKNIKQYGDIDQRFIEPLMFHYCNRQGARTAAANYGFANEFDKIMEGYNKRMTLRFIPHI